MNKPTSTVKVTRCTGPCNTIRLGVDCPNGHPSVLIAEAENVPLWIRRSTRATHGQCPQSDE